MAKITIVDKKDNVTGSEERSIARKKGLRHRIVRIFITNSKGDVLLQKRSDVVADNPGKWDQSVGGHVDEGEDYITAAKRETLEELGICIENLNYIGKFYIERNSPDGFIRRFQTVFTCEWDGPIHIDKSEVAEVKWFSVQEINEWISKSPDTFTKSFSKAFSLLKISR